jgi:hypothetical protein
MLIAQVYRFTRDSWRTLRRSEERRASDLAAIVSIDGIEVPMRRRSAIAVAHSGISCVARRIAARE